MSVEITNASICHAEFSSASHREPYLVLLRGQILKQVQDDHLLWAIVICYIEEHKDMFYIVERKRLKDVNLNSRGLLSPRILTST